MRIVKKIGFCVAVIFHLMLFFGLILILAGCGESPGYEPPGVSDEDWKPYVPPPAIADKEPVTQTEEGFLLVEVRGRSHPSKHTYPLPGACVSVFVDGKTIIVGRDKADSFGIARIRIPERYWGHLVSFQFYDGIHANIQHRTYLTDDKILRFVLPEMSF